MSSRINEVHCGILEFAKRYRNKCGMTLTNFLFTAHKRRLTKFAFTLAETLVVMGIIGVVAALTIPNLNQSTGDREKVAKVKKIYANLEDAFGRAQAVYGPYDEWYDGFDSSDDESRNTRFAERMLEFMKVSKNCGLEETGCWASTNVVDYEGNDVDEVSYDDHPLKEYNVILSDGTSMSFYAVDIGRIRFDIDGPNKGKNAQGIDIFDVTVDTSDTNDASCGEMKKNQIYPSTCPDQWTGAIDKNYTTGWVIQNGNLDYLKCDDLNWETKTSCK